MIEEDEITAARNLALQKIGRNVVHFQRIEALLKILVTFANFSAPLKDLPNYLERRQSPATMSTMGTLVGKLADAIKSEPLRSPDDSRDIWISNSIAFADGEAAEKWSSEMQQVVHDRNSLIHQTLALFDENSLQSCVQLSEELDLQHGKLLQTRAGLGSILSALKEAHLELMANAEEIAARLSSSGSAHDA